MGSATNPDHSTTAAGGHLIHTDAAGERLVTALSEQLELVEQWAARARGLARPLPLGANPVGAAMAERFSRWADGADGSFVAVLENYRAGLERARAAARSAMHRYRDLECHEAGTFRGIAGC